MEKLDERTQQALDNITAKTPEELRDNEMRFLRARSSYLTLKNKKKFKSVLGAFTSNGGSTGPSSSVSQEKSYRELQAQAKKLGLRYVGVSRVNLLKSLKLS